MEKFTQKKTDEGNIYLRFIGYPVPKPYKVPGTTMTVPNMAPDLQTLLESSVNGQPLPLTHRPLFDADENAGTARVEAASATIADGFNEIDAVLDEELRNKAAIEERKDEDAPQQASAQQGNDKDIIDS